MKPLYVRVDQRDNVAIVANPEGVRGKATFPCGLTTTEATPQAHKVALGSLDAGDPVIRYGQVIGYATRPIRAGAWVREELIETAPAPSLDSVSISTAVPPAPAPLDGYSFEGYPNPAGGAGARNLLGITTTVQCVAPTVEHAVRRIRDEVLPRFPGVDGVTATTHTYGCGVAIDAPAATVPIRTLRNLSKNPNLANAPLVVGLGCEKLQPDRLLPIVEEGPYTIRFQDGELQGFGDIVAAIMRGAERQREQAARRRRKSLPASELEV
ncbi:MAG: galactarate dehydratase, partial [bacterium]|nr:galactarate dehydratase [bacterium]